MILSYLNCLSVLVEVLALPTNFWFGWAFSLYTFFNSLLSWFTLFSCSMRVCHTSEVIGVSAVIVCESVGFVAGNRVRPA